MMTTVKKGSDPRYMAIYSLPPDKAVVAAYEQEVKHNFQTWDYSEPDKHPLFKRQGEWVTCGGFWAKVKK